MINTFTGPRAILYAFAWFASIVELGLTGYRVHWTKQDTGCYDAIVVELLVTSCLAILWAPLMIAALVQHKNDTNAAPTAQTRMQRARRCLTSEFLPLCILWVMFLVGAAIATNNWPSKHFIGTGKQAEVLVTIVAFSWIAFSVLSITGVLALMHYAAAHPLEHHVTEKLPSPAVAPATV